MFHNPPTTQLQIGSPTSGAQPDDLSADCSISTTLTYIGLHSHHEVRVDRETDRHMSWLTRDMLLLRSKRRFRRLLNKGNLLAASLHFSCQRD